MSKLKFTIAGLFIILCLTFGATVNFGQTTVFTYQGKLTDGGTAATATDDMIFRLFDDPAAGSQIGSSINNPTAIGDI